MLVVVDGPDKSGKTTLVKEIAERFGYDFVHFGVPGPDPAREYADFLLNLKKPTICDRFLYGEFVYGPLLRGKSLIKPLQRTVLERLMRLRGAIVLHAATPLPVIMRRIDQLGDDMITPEQNIKAYYAFNKVMSEVNVRPFGEYNAENIKSVDRIIESMIGVIDIMRYTAKVADTICTGIGTILGSKIVFVGEELNYKVTWIKKPFDNGVSSEFLNDCIKAAKIPEHRVYVVNSTTLRDNEALFLMSTGCTKFVALGAKASKLLDYYKIEHEVLDHPQYIKRFKLKEKDNYINSLSKLKAPCLV